VRPGGRVIIIEATVKKKTNQGHASDARRRLCYLYRFKYAINKKDETWICFSKASMVVLYRRMRQAEHK